MTVVRVIIWLGLRVCLDNTGRAARQHTGTELSQLQEMT